VKKELSTKQSQRGGNVAIQEAESTVQGTPFVSWEEFKGAFCEHLFPGEPFSRGRYLFRGHRDPGWKLMSTFDRMFMGQGKSKRLQLAKDMLSIFRRNLEGIVLPSEVRDSESLLLALGQHYGLPTRLLDWTESPYIAAFFAYNSQTLWGVHDQSIAIWVLDTSHPIWSSDYGVEIIDVPSFGNQRIRNQSGKFTLSKTPFLTLEEYVAAHEDDGKPLMKFLVPASDATRALADLDAMGIHHGTVYPEIEGAAQMALFRTVLQHSAFVQTQTSRPA
jgi:hypothetical protein